MVRSFFPRLLKNALSRYGRSLKILRTLDAQKGIKLGLKTNSLNIQLYLNSIKNI